MELVDQKRFQPVPIILWQNIEGARDRGDHATTVNVADQDGRKVGRLGEPHVRQIAVPQVDLAGASGPFNQHDVGP